MATDKNFKLSKTTKRALSHIKDKVTRDEFKRIMIDAEDSFERNKKRVGKEKQVVND